MSKVTSVNSSAYYLQKWTDAQTAYDDECLKLAGVKSTKNANDILEFESRLESMQKVIDNYKTLYENAYDSENNAKKYRPLRTYNWGS